jgi:hypothetical protein
MSSAVVSPVRERANEPFAPPSTGSAVLARLTKTELPAVQFAIFVPETTVSGLLKEGVKVKPLSVAVSVAEPVGIPASA